MTKVSSGLTELDASTVLTGEIEVAVLITALSDHVHTPRNIELERGVATKIGAFRSAHAHYTLKHYVTYCTASRELKERWVAKWKRI